MTESTGCYIGINDDFLRNKHGLLIDLNCNKPPHFYVAFQVVSVIAPSIQKQDDDCWESAIDWNAKPIVPLA